MALKQLTPVEETIGNIKFYITPFAAFKTANLTGELASTLAPLLAALAPLVGDDNDGKDGEKNLMDVDASKAAEAMAGCSALSGDKLEQLMRKLLLGGHIVVELPPDEENGETEPEAHILDNDLVNEVFCGEVQDMFILCFYVIRLNFKGFFKKLAGLSGKVGTAKQTKTQRKVL